MNLMQHMAKKGYQGLGLISAIPWTWPIAESRCLRSGQKIQHYVLPSSLISIGYFPCVLASQCSRKGERSCSEQLTALREFMANKQPWAGKEETIPLFHHSFSHPSQAFRVGSLEKTAAQDQGTGSQRSLSNRCSRGTMLASYQQYSRGKSPCSCAWWLIL